MRIREILPEASFDIKKRGAGQVNFPSSSMGDSFITKTIQAIAQHTKQPVQAVQSEIQGKIDELSQLATDSPVLYETINKNAVEQNVFTKFWKEGVRAEGAPSFDNVTFHKLVRQLRIDYDEFFPLRSYIDKRHVISPVIKLLDSDDTEFNQIPTAAASPSGVFYFNRKFMQSLLDYAHVKGLKPQGKKFAANGGEFPDGYAWLEFIIMHEFMHYSNDDFYYQKVIPNANPTLINWVGDFRTNYLLTKSGFEALPLGLYNDKINYDRQKTYTEMYDIVKEEFEKIQPDQQDILQQILDQLADEHQQGNEEGQQSDVGEEGEGQGQGDKESDEDGEGEGSTTIEDLEGQAKENADKIGEGGGKEGEEGKEGKSKGRGKGKSKGKRTKGDNPDPYKIDYSKIRPRFNWKTLIDRFLKTGLAKTEETYAKPHRRSITSVDVARQVGAAAIRPAEKPVDFSDAKLMFILDNSGSMTDVIAKVVANVKQLLSRPQFRKSTILTLKFSGSAEMYKVNIAGNRAGQIFEPHENPKKWDKKVDEVFGTSFGGGTYIGGNITNNTIKALRAGYNVLLCTDTDVLYGDNLTHLLKMIDAAPTQMYVVFDERESYLRFRQETGINTPYITHF